MAEQNYTVTASPNSVTLYLPDIGGLRMTAEGAVHLATQLLDAANEVSPGLGGFKIGGYLRG